MCSATWLALSSAGPSEALAQEYTFATIRYPMSNVTTAMSVSNAGVVAGWYNIGRNTNNGFIYNGTTYQAVIIPGGSLQAFFMNEAGDGSGYYFGGAGATSFIRINGTPTPFTGPCTGTRATAINDVRQIVGTCDLGGGASSGFLRQANGTITTFQVPGGHATTANGISTAGVIVGSYLDAQNNKHGYIYDGTNFTTVDAPGATTTSLNGISAAGTYIVGNYSGGLGGAHSFYFDGTDFIAIDLNDRTFAVNDDRVVAMSGSLATPQ
jgi:uncharacterized membrane protein